MATENKSEKSPTVYIESTVISYHTGRPTRDLIVAAHQELTQEWWENILPKCSPFISQFVLDEISRGDQDAVDKRIKSVEGMSLLEVIQPIIDLGLEYYDAIGIPEKARTDAFHMAIAVHHGKRLSRYMELYTYRWGTSARYC